MDFLVGVGVSVRCLWGVRVGALVISNVVKIRARPLPPLIPNGAQVVSVTAALRSLIRSLVKVLRSKQSIAKFYSALKGELSVSLRASYF